MKRVLGIVVAIVASALIYPPSGSAWAPASGHTVAIASPGPEAVFDEGDVIPVRADVNDTTGPDSDGDGVICEGPIAAPCDGVPDPDPNCPILSVRIEDDSGGIVQSWFWDTSVNPHFDRLADPLSAGDYLVVVRLGPGNPESCVMDPRSRAVIVVLRDVPTPPPDVFGVLATPKPFYPILRDGRLDFTRIYWTLDSEADVLVRIRNRAGVVRSFGWYEDLSANRWSIPWAGRNSNGRTVKRGRFRIEVIAVNNIGRDYAFTRVRVRRGAP